MTKELLVYITLTIVLKGSSSLQCHGGVATKADNVEFNSKKVFRHTCPDEPGQSCMTAETLIVLNGMKTRVMSGSCAAECRAGSTAACDDVIATMQMLIAETDNVEALQYNVTDCHVSCCNHDFCNKEPNFDPEPTLGDRKCYSGMRHETPDGVLTDDVREIYCPISEKLGPEISCLKAAFTMNGGTPETTGSMWLYQCQPAVVCESFTCDLVMRTLPESVRRIVTECNTDCCSGQLCNGVRRCFHDNFSFVFTLISCLFAFICAQS